jgi:hypothetical protein
MSRCGILNSFEVSFKPFLSVFLLVVSMCGVHN